MGNLFAKAAVQDAIFQGCHQFMISFQFLQQFLVLSCDKERIDKSGLYALFFELSRSFFRQVVEITQTNDGYMAAVCSA